jgi:hypothetical protein
VVANIRFVTVSRYIIILILYRYLRKLHTVVDDVG